MHKRVVLKLSGEALMGHGHFGYDFNFIERIVLAIQEVRQTGVQISVVVGGGNICRGGQIVQSGVARATADHMGMLATVMNGLVLQSMMDKAGFPSYLVSAVPVTGICEAYNPRYAIEHLYKGEVVICTAGTGNPLFTTDSAAVLRAIEMNCDLLLKGTQTDGVYSADPRIHNQAKRFEQISYAEVIKHELAVMDLTSIVLARDHNLPIRIFSISEPNNLPQAIKAEGIFTDIK